MLRADRAVARTNCFAPGRRRRFRIAARTSWSRRPTPMARCPSPPCSAAVCRPAISRSNWSPRCTARRSTSRRVARFPAPRTPMAITTCTRRERGEAGWSSRLTAPSGVQSVQPGPGGFSPDLDYSVWNSAVSAARLLPNTNYVRQPSGAFEGWARKPSGTIRHAQAKWITAGKGHLIFTSGHAPSAVDPEARPGVQLEPNRLRRRCTRCMTARPEGCRWCPCCRGDTHSDRRRRLSGHLSRRFLRCIHGRPGAV